MADRHPPRPLVYAHYMHCYILGALPDPAANAGPDDPDLWPRSETSERSWWSSRLAPLAGSGQAGVEIDFELAATAGLDAFAVLITPRALSDGRFAPGLRLVAQVAQNARIKLFPDLWDDWDLSNRRPSREELRAYGRSVEELMDEFPAAFLRYDGRPLISLGNPLRNGRQTPFAWDDYQTIFEAWGGPQAVFLILNTRWPENELPSEWGRGVDALSLWSATQGWGDAQTAVLVRHARRYGKPLSWPVSSSYYGGRRGTDNIAESLGASRFTDQWRLALANHSAFAAIQSWNDFSEDHAITETNYRGKTLIALNRYFADWFHHGTPPAADHDRIWLFHHRQLVHARLVAATMTAASGDWHAVPVSDYLNVLTHLREAAEIHVYNGSAEWTRSVQPGFHEWLIYVPEASAQRHPPDFAASGRSDPYPIDSADRTVTLAERIDPGPVRVALVRNGAAVSTVQSRLPIAGQGRWQDLSLVGSMDGD